jgi:2-polyprenyl-6-methoxyphenol hydroxylase-like FAD-dependent oxidoreductase
MLVKPAWRRKNFLRRTGARGVFSPAASQNGNRLLCLTATHAPVQAPLFAHRMHPQAIIIGAGPVGLSAALTMASQGIAVTVLEARPHLATASKASTFHPPTLDIFNAFGLMDEILARGQRVPFIQYRDVASGIRCEFPLAVLEGETAFPFRIHLEQATITPMILARLNALPTAELRFGREVVDFAQDDGGVTVTARAADGFETFRAGFAFIADGARSTVREKLGLAFEGSAYDTRVLRVFTRRDLDFLLPGIRPLTYLYDGDESLAFLKMPDLWRIVSRAPPGIEDEAALDPGFFRAHIGRFLGLKLAQYDDLWADIYGEAKRVASAVQVGRAFLMGDAAHISTTRGGMNMNCGIHDAFAFGMAMAEAARRDDLAPLAACARERAHVARVELIGRTDAVVTTGTRWLEQAVEAAGSAEALHRFVRGATMIDLSPVRAMGLLGRRLPGLA